MDAEDVPVENQLQKPSAPSGHDRHCFVVMPSGRTPSEIRWFKGWYEVVIQPAVSAAGYEAKLAAAEERPSAINDEIRAHLAFDPMVVVDLGGISPDADPNPNVMYELGIRHALSLPLVMLAWKGQRLPFDVGNQRVIMEGRELLDLETSRTKLVNFIQSAAAGFYYRPMEAVGRVATLDVASAALSEDSLLGALVHEVRDLRAIVLASTTARPRRPFVPSVPNVKKLLRDKPFRKELYPLFIETGGTPRQWGQLLKSQLPPDLLDESAQWDADRWKAFVVDQARQWLILAPPDFQSPMAPEAEQPEDGSQPEVPSGDSQEDPSTTDPGEH
jgi:hypothetical protein